TPKRRGCPFGTPSCFAPGAMRRADGASTMTRVLSIWLPNLAVERWAKRTDYPPDSPVVLTVEGTHGPVIHAVTQAAARRGARAGARCRAVRRPSRLHRSPGDCADRGGGLGAQPLRRVRADAAAYLRLAARC